MAHDTQDLESLTSKLLIVPGLGVSTVIALLLTIANACNAVSTGNILLLVNNHRDSVAFVVQVTSAVLGIFHVFALRKYCMFPHLMKLLTNQQRLL